jgi:HAD superfamily hydrolase (TIGR01509 family)
MDGVIINSFHYHLESIKIFAAKHGFQLDENEIMFKYFGRQNRVWMPALFDKKMEEVEIEALAHEKESIYREIYAPHIQPVTGLLDFLQDLHLHQVPMAIGTSAPKENVAFVLENTRSQSYFKGVIDDSMVKVGKPDPDVFLQAARLIGLPARQCVVIEDSQAGIEAGKRSGAKVIGMATTHRREELPDTDLTVDDFRELDYQTISNLF